MAETAALTKKQQKALAFRSKQKAKKLGKGDGEQLDVPEQDPVEEEEVVEAPVQKKRKRDDAIENGGKVVEAEVPKGKGKGKAKTAWDEEEEKDEGKKSKKEVKQRFILFVGNLDFKTTREAIQTHFEPAIDHKPAVRLLTTKPPPPQKPKSRGIAFLELPSSTELQACLKLHHSELQGRKINVELTAGGGGKSDKRSTKIKERNERVGGQRERRAEREAEEGGGGVVEEEPKFERKQAEVLDGPDGKVKVRNGRRVKVKADGEPPSKRPNTQTGWQNRGTGAQRGRGGRPWQPTGANAVSVP